MKKSIYLVIIIFGLLSCKDRKAIHSEKLTSKSLEKFDLKRFDENKKDSTYEYLLKDTIVKLYEDKNYYKKVLIANNYSFKREFVYSKTTNSLVNELCHFYGMPIGVWKSYEENGTLKNLTNYDEGFDFTIKDLISMFKKELQIDLINDSNYKSLVIERSFYKRFYFITSYCYSIQIATMAGTRTIKIDGKTGEIINDITAYIEE